MTKQARITSKGQITIPIEVRRLLGLEAGDDLIFDCDGSGISLRKQTTGDPFEKYRAIGNPGIKSGRASVIQWVRELRGE